MGISRTTHPGEHNAMSSRETAQRRDERKSNESRALDAHEGTPCRKHRRTSYPVDRPMDQSSCARQEGLPRSQRGRVTCKFLSVRRACFTRDDTTSASCRRHSLTHSAGRSAGRSCLSPDPTTLLYRSEFHLTARCQSSRYRETPAVLSARTRVCFLVVVSRGESSTVMQESRVPTLQGWDDRGASSPACGCA